VNCLLQDQNIQTSQNAKSLKRAEQSCAQVLLEKLKENK
jgi:ribonuclease III